MKPETIALHAGYAPDEQHAVAVPIHQTTSFAFDNAQHAADLFDLKEDPQEMRSVHDKPEYSRVRSELEREFYRLRKQFDAPAFTMKR